MLDTLRYSKRLQSAGVSKEQAEALSEALYETAATRAQLENAEQRLSAEITGLGQKLRTEIKSLEQELRAETKSLGQELHARIDNVEQRLSAGIKQLRWMTGVSISLGIAILIKLLVA